MKSNIHGLASAITLGYNICLNILHYIIKYNIVFGNKNKIWTIVKVQDWSIVLWNKINIFWYTFWHT